MSEGHSVPYLGCPDDCALLTARTLANCETDNCLIHQERCRIAQKQAIGHPRTRVQSCPVLSSDMRAANQT